MAIIMGQISNMILSSETFAALLGAIIGGLLTICGSVILWLIQQRKELKNVSRGLFFDISNLEVRFNEFMDMREKFNLLAQEKAKEQGTKVEHAIMSTPIPFYDDNGLFYAFSKDIARFDSKLSSVLYEFYITVDYVEKLRGRIARLQEHSNNLTEFDYKIMDVDYGEMVESVKKAQKLIPVIKQYLNKNFR